MDRLSKEKFIVGIENKVGKEQLQKDNTMENIIIEKVEETVEPG